MYPVPHVKRRNLAYGDFNQFLSFGISDVHGARNARIETVNRPQDLERLLGIVHDMTVFKRGLVGTWLALRVAWTGIPGARHDRLVVCEA